MQLDRSKYYIGGLVLCAGLATVALSGCAGAPAQSSVTDTPRLVTVAVGAKPATLDPDLAGSITDADAVHLIAGTLFNLRGSGVSSPGLASGVHVSADGLTQTYSLRPELRFSDGSPLTAQDVVATFERSMHDKSNTQAGFLKPVTGVSAPDAHTVVFRLSRPYPSFRTILGYPAFAILPAKDLNPSKGTAKGNFFADPVSAGPYKLLSWGGGLTETFVVNPYYWGPKPLVHTVRFVTIPDFNTSLNELRSGQVDFSMALPPSMLPALDHMSGIHALAVKAYGFSALFMNDSRPPLNDVRVRRAISLAVNRDEIAKNVFSGKNTPIAGFWPSIMTGYDPSISTRPDVARAKQLLAGTQCAHGCSIKLVYETADQPWAAQAVVIIQNNLAAIGIKVQLAQVDAVTEVADIGGEKYQMSLYGLYDSANVPDGLAAWGLLKSGGLNSLFSGYNSPRMNQLVAQADESTGSARQTALREINVLFGQDQPFVPIADWLDVSASRLPQSILSTGASNFVDVGVR